MRQNAIWLWILGLIAMTASMAGCGGGGNAPFRGETPFTGSWSGNWNVVGTPDVGVMTLTVADDSTMRGTFVNTGTGETGRVEGATHPDGLFNASFIVDGSGAKIKITGSMAILDNALGGDAVYTRPGGAARGMSFTLTVAQANNPLAGSFGATWSVFGSDDGVMNVTINSNGVISGQFGNNDTGETGVVSGTVQNNGHYDIFFVVTGTGEIIKLSGEMIKDDTGSEIEWQGTGTYQREGGPVQGFNFSTISANP